MFTEQTIRDGHAHIDRLFRVRFPVKGLPERPAQIDLCHRMLDAMLSGEITLCEAGTGIGKAYAYLVAGDALFRCRQQEGLPAQPILISTSSIALQRAIPTEYLPFLSRALMADGQPTEPVRAVVRKGKAHYVCDRKLEERLRTANLAHMSQRRVTALNSLSTQLDLDAAVGLNPYDQAHVCVPPSCLCKEQECRYRRFLEQCGSSRIEFQICNHNLLLADAIRRSRGLSPLLPRAAALVIDEAHKLPETARQMFGVTLAPAQLNDLRYSLKNECYILAYKRLSEAARPLLRLLRRPPPERCVIGAYLRLLPPVHSILSVIRRQIGGAVTPETQALLSQVWDTVTQLSRPSRDTMVYLAEDGEGGSLLCGTPPDLGRQLKSTLWSCRRPAILTSGTLAVGGSFDAFQTTIGLDETEGVAGYVAPSPYPYRENCLLYFPEQPIRSREGRATAYYDRLTREIAQLLHASQGHALVLFTSYAALSAVKSRLEREALPFPVYAMGRNDLHTAETFKARPGAVLLAAGPAWEGMDFPGDGVSLLILPRLPFSCPDTRKERERERYPSLAAYIQAVAIPEMQTKHRQGFGRAIRSENDTCVIALLDSRAAPEGRYHSQVMAALPEMDVVREVSAMRGFLLEKKRPDYWNPPELPSEKDSQER